MKNRYKVDIVIPIYNSLEWLKYCIKSIFLNTDYDILGKIYLINDCSTENVDEYLCDIKKNIMNILKLLIIKKI